MIAMLMEWANVITWLLVLVGWFVVHRATLIRERRKEKREVSIQMCRVLAELQTAAIDFHTAPNFDARKSSDLAQQVERVILQLQKIPLSELQVPTMCMINLRRRITKHNIDPSDFACQTAASKIVSDIRNVVTDLIFFIEEARESVWE